ncbi:MAG: hypothetical protein HQK79_09025 [Desulfobacterales bacterium]|nr:hypothetical protein [Desulfobacterales bacterium]MBF0397110.1 hypothetical protein [Desulfobacterales bacterium]
MKKVLLLILSMFLYSCLTSSQGGKSFDQTRFTVISEPEYPIPEACKYLFSQEGLPRIGVVNFTNHSEGKVNIPEAWGWWKNAEVKLPEVVADHVISEIVNLGGTRVYTRNEVERVLEEHKFQMSGIVDDTSYVKIGKLVGLQYLVTGSIDNIGFTTGAMALVMGSRPQIEIQIMIRIIDIATAEIILSKSITGKDILDTADYVGVISGIKNALTKGLEDIRPMLSKRFALSGYIIQTMKGPDGSIAALINIGEKQKISTGSKIEIYALQDIKDPVTGKSICDKIKLPVDAEVTDQIQDNKSWIIIKGEPDKISRVHKGCVVERQQVVGQSFTKKLGL